MSQALSPALTSTLNITAGTVVKAAEGRVGRITVNTAGAAGALYDITTVGGVSAASLVFTIPAVVGVYYLDWPMLKGIVVVPGAAQVVSISYS